MTSPYAAWARASLDAWTLGVEASTVIGLRVAKIAMGGREAGEEAHLMVSEKLQSTMELQLALFTGQLGTTPMSGAQATFDHYRGKIAANRRRLL